MHIMKIISASKFFLILKKKRIQKAVYGDRRVNTTLDVVDIRSLAEYSFSRHARELGKRWREKYM